MLKKLIECAAFITALFLLLSCGTSKKTQKEILYLQDIDSIKNQQVRVPELKIEKGDMLSILVYSDNSDATVLFNQPQLGGASQVSGGGTSGAGSGSILGYLVDEKGEIYFHSLGKIKVEGMTKLELSEFLISKLSKYLQNPYISLRFMNTRITVLGEVKSPGTLNIPDKKVSILDAIGLAGDLTIFGRRDNIVVVREENGIRTSGRLDIRRSDVFLSPYYYLQQNDIVYVEPSRKKPAANDQILVRNIGLVASILSVVTIILTLITR
jgi:polysaccharide export outer membrane protein